MDPGSAAQREERCAASGARPNPHRLCEDLSFLSLPSLLLAPFRDESNEGAEGWRRLTPARIIQEWSWKRRAPVVEDANQRAGFHGVAHVAFEGHPEAHAVMDRPDRQAEIGRDHFRRRRDFHHAAGLFELPIQHRAAAEAGADASMVQQILRLLRPAML